MRPDLVVVLAPVLDHDLRIDSIAKPLIDRHSSRNFPLKDSFVPFCQGFPGSISAVSIRS